VSDYTLVITDKYAADDRGRYFDFLRNVANRCLEEANCGIATVEELLEERMPANDEEKIRLVGKDFSGWQQYAFLSSGIVRTFVSLLKDTVSATFPDISRRSRKINTISFQVQRSVVLRKSGIHRLSYLETEDPHQIIILVDTLAAMFREELVRSTRRALQKVKAGQTWTRDDIRTVSQFHIRNPEALSLEAQTAILQAVRVGLLQTPLGPRQPQQRRRIPQAGYKLHRLLTPYYELSFANRHPRTLTADLLNDIWSLSQDEFVTRALTTYPLFEESSEIVEVPGEQEQLEFDYGDDEDM